MIAYTQGSGNILSQLLGVSNTVGSLIFTIPAIIVVWFGLKATGIAEKFVSTGMIVLILVLILCSFLSSKSNVSQAIRCGPGPKLAEAAPVRLYVTRRSSGAMAT